MAKTAEKPMSKTALMDIMAGRFFTYSLLKRFFIEQPTAEFLELFLKDDLLGAISYQDRSEQINKGTELISFHLKDPDLTEYEQVGELQADYTVLFIGIGKMPSPPYESVYRSPKKLVFQDETIRVRHKFAKQGLLPEHFKREPDDHIGLELDFMAHMCDWSLKAIQNNELAKAQKYLKAQKDFIDEHLMQWVPDFCGDILKNSKTTFFQGVSHILMGFLMVEKEEIDNLLKQVRLRKKLEKEKKAATA